MFLLLKDQRKIEKIDLGKKNSDKALGANAEVGQLLVRTDLGAGNTYVLLWLFPLLLGFAPSTPSCYLCQDVF